jgi:hypothetical protein
VAIRTATSVVTSEIGKGVTLKATVTTGQHSERLERVLIGTATVNILFKARGAVEGGIEFVHTHIIPMTTDI